MFSPTFSFSSFLPQPLPLHVIWSLSKVFISEVTIHVLLTFVSFYCNNIAKPLLLRPHSSHFNSFFSSFHEYSQIITSETHTSLQSPGTHVRNISNVFNQHCSQASSEEQELKVFKPAVNSALQNAPKEYKMWQIKGSKFDLWSVLMNGWVEGAWKFNIHKKGGSKSPI